jgi:hypothetical protein
MHLRVPVAEIRHQQLDLHPVAQSGRMTGRVGEQLTAFATRGSHPERLMTHGEPSGAV